MAENDSTDESQKTEEPTARRLEEARKRGQVAQSREVTNWMMLFAATVLIVMAGPGIMADIRDRLATFLAYPDKMTVDGQGLAPLLRDLVVGIGADLALPVFVLLLTGVLSGFVQTGAILTTETIKPDIDKISPMRGFERLFSLRSLVEFAKGIAKLVFVSIAGYMALSPYFDGIEHFVGQDVGAALFDTKFLFIKMMVAALVVLFIVAALDYFYQYRDFMQKMRMSKQEIKEEFKQTEGDQIVKAKLRQMREAKARQRMMQAVPTADVVITNPTHYAVALKYDSKEMDAPTMVAKGVDTLAQKIREVAKDNKVTIIENPPLARALYDSMDIDQIIPGEHYKAVAEVISYVFKLKGKKL